MLVDPEFKQKMKDLCVRDLCDPAWVKLPPTGINITIDPNSEEEYLASSWNSADGAKNVNANGFWTRRTKNRKAEEKAKEKKEIMELLRERAAERKRLSETGVAAFSNNHTIGSYSLSTKSSIASSLLALL